MLNSMDAAIRLTLPTQLDLRNIDMEQNYTVLFSGVEEDGVSRIADPEYEQFLADVWVGIVLTLMVLSCVCCMCSCLLYHKFQQWKRRVLGARRTASNIENGRTMDNESLPSYTVVSGLPSYDEALEQLRQVQVHNQPKNELSTDIKSLERSTSENWVPQTPPTPMGRLSVSELFQLYKTPVVSVDCKT